MCCIVKVGLEARCDCNNIAQLPSRSQYFHHLPQNEFHAECYYWEVRHLALARIVAPLYSLVLTICLETCNLYSMVLGDAVTSPDFPEDNDLIMNTYKL